MRRVIEDIRARMVEFLPRLRRFAYALTGDLDNGDDLVQETCARALARADLWQPGTRLDSWMFRIAQNLWFDRARAMRARGETADIDTVIDLIQYDGREVTDHRLTLSAVEQNMKRLPPDQKILIALVCIDGLSYKEAAEVLDVPIGTVMSRLARARRALYEAVNGEAAPRSSAKTEGRHE
jgi:RNA polymerase sigma-70 factor (ECF subfamily)